MINTRNLSVPEQMYQHWQQTVDLIAEIVEIPASLIMRIHKNEIEVIASSHSPDNPYRQNEVAELGHGLYCETVIRSRSELLVPNALTDSDWDHNPDIALGMISYCGLPLCWPNGDPFGTICMLDGKENCYTPKSRQLLARFQETIEADLKILFQQSELVEANQLLEERIKERTNELEQLNHQLAGEIDRRNAMASTLEYSQQYDSLTGLANRSSLINRLEHMLKHPIAHNDELAVIYLGLHNFKSINHSYGHVIGDQILQAVSLRIQKLSEVNLYIARGPGDEFIMLIPAARAAEKAMELIGQLSASLSPAFNIERHSITISFNIGVALAPKDSQDAIALIQKAGAAMSAAKELKLPYHFFDSETQSNIDERYRLESHLADALENNEMSLHYQPLICTQTRKILGAEALLRWHNSVLGNVAPDRFISLAERTGHIVEIGNFVLRTAIKQAARWHKQLSAPFRIAINISPIQFRDQQLAAQIQQLLTIYQLPPESLELEITEGVLLQDAYQAELTISTIQKLGVRISLDDFGTGYSSLSYLQKYSFDTLKIDRSFIANLDTREQDKELARAIIAIA